MKQKMQGGYYEYEPNPVDRSIEVQREEPQFIGILDAQGRKLYRQQELVGFQLCKK